MKKRNLGGGNKPRIKPGTIKGDRLFGALRGGFGGRHTAMKINELGVSPGKKLISCQVVLRYTKQTFGMVCAKRSIIETDSCNKASTWSVARFAIYLKFRNDIDEGRRSLEGNLFVNKHSKFCVLGDNAHHGKSMNHEWHGTIDRDGN